MEWLAKERARDRRKGRQEEEREGRERRKDGKEAIVQEVEEGVVGRVQKMEEREAESFLELTITSYLVFSPRRATPDAHHRVVCPHPAPPASGICCFPHRQPAMRRLSNESDSEHRV